MWVKIIQVVQKIVVVMVAETISLMIIHWYAGLAGLAFAAFANTNYSNDSIFIVFAKTTLERKPKVYKSNMFLFTVNHQ